MNLLKVLLPTWKQLRGYNWNDTEGLWGWVYGKTLLKEWYKGFKNGRIAAEGNRRSGRSSSIKTTLHNIKRVRFEVDEDHRLTGVTFKKKLILYPICCWEKFYRAFGNDSSVCEIHCKITHEKIEKTLCFEIAEDNLEMVFDNENVFKKMRFGYELWVYGSDHETLEGMSGQMINQKTLRWSFEKVAWCS